MDAKDLRLAGGRYNTMPDERVDVADLLDTIRIYVHVILDICEAA